VGSTHCLELYKTVTNEVKDNLEVHTSGPKLSLIKQGLRELSPSHKIYIRTGRKFSLHIVMVLYIKAIT